MKKTLLLLFLTIAVCLNACKKDTGNNTVTPAKPTVTNVQPKNPLPGDVVTITGTNFGTLAADVKVTIGAQAITITTVTATEIKFALPTGITTGDIAVAIKDIIAANTDPQKATITPQTPVPPVATILTINPTSSKVGDVVSITGTNFSTTLADNVVKFNGVVATVTGSVTTVLTVTVPATATTGAVTLSVKGAAVVTGPTFTVNASTTGTGTAVTYITTTGGTATFSKIATSSSEIGAMVIDKINNTLYYSDYSVFAPNHPGSIYKLKLDGSAATVLSTDPLISQVVNLAVDATGNVYAVTSLDKAGGVQANIIKIDAGTAAVTTIAANFNYGGSGSELNIDSQGGIWIGYGQKYNSTTNKFDRNKTFPYASYRNTSEQGDDIYVDNGTSDDVTFVKYNLLTKTGAATDFTLSGLFKQDNANLGSNTHGTDVQSRYATDGNENFYAIYPIDGDASSGGQEHYVIRKTKNGSGTSTLISKFANKIFSVASPVMYQNPRLNTGLIFQADAAGNLYFKDNGTDIIKVTP